MVVNISDEFFNKNESLFKSISYRGKIGASNCGYTYPNSHFWWKDK